jgi:GTP-binding protein LepA
VTEVRNFSIIAHIDHGKSTLADRLIQQAGLINDRQFRDQLLDNLEIERERGITIKSQTVSLPYTDRAGRAFELNLIDTPGHVDFSYEVSRALASCEGVLLLVDASQGVQAQTVANLYLAMEHELTVVPVINKIDLPSADLEATRAQIDQELALDPDQAVLVSAKTGAGLAALLEALVQRIPAPPPPPDDTLRALIFDAQYDSFRGAVISCRVFSGSVAPGDTIRLMSAGTTHRVEEVGRFRLERQPQPRLNAGEVGYLMAGIKTVGQAWIGDTLTQDRCPAKVPLPGFRDAKPVVFTSLYPIASDDYPGLADALEKYQLNDAALQYTKDSSAALGQGFRAGFLGLLHLEVAQERLRREFGQSLILTAPSVQYRCILLDGSTVTVDNPAHYPDPTTLARVEEPFIRASILIPDRYMGAVMKLCLDRRGGQSDVQYTAPGRMEIRFDLPLAEVLFDFYDKLKSITQGYGSFDYELIDYRPAEVVKVDILVNTERVDALSMIVHRDRARPRALQACQRLKESIPRHMFRIPIQGAIGAKIICRETISPFRKDVTAKCYGGDITRKRKLLEKQRAGKQRMKMVGNVQVPQQAFVAVLQTKSD